MKAKKLPTMGRVDGERGPKPARVELAPNHPQLCATCALSKGSTRVREVAKLILKLDTKNILDRQGYEVERERSEDELSMKG